MKKKRKKQEGSREGRRKKEKKKLSLLTEVKETFSLSPSLFSRSLSHSFLARPTLFFLLLRELTSGFPCRVVFFTLSRQQTFN